MVEQIEGRDLRVDAEILRQIAEPMAQASRIGDDIESVENDRPFVRFLKRGNGAHERRLAGAIRPEKTEETFADFKVDVVECANAVRIGFREMRDREQSWTSLSWLP